MKLNEAENKKQKIRPKLSEILKKEINKKIPQS